MGMRHRRDKRGSGWGKGAASEDHKTTPQRQQTTADDEGSGTDEQTGEQNVYNSKGRRGKSALAKTTSFEVSENDDIFW